MNNGFSLLKNKVIKKIISENLNSIFEIIKKAYVAHELGHTIVPGSHFLYFPDHHSNSRIIALPGYIASEFNVAGIKWISSNPKNLENKLPRASAVIILNHPETGIPFACLEGSFISAVRTAASAVLAAEHMHAQDRTLENLGLIGNGPIANEIYHWFIYRGWKIKHLTLFDIQPSTSIAFQSTVNTKNHKTIRIANSIEELVKSCDAIVFATTSKSPYLKDNHLVNHSPLMLNISLRDLDPKILVESHNVVDDITHVLSANTSPHLTQQQYGHTHFIDGTLGGLIQKKYQLTTNKPNIFSPMGLGILDLAVAKYVFDKALISNDHTSIDNFFGEQNDSSI